MPQGTEGSNPSPSAFEIFMSDEHKTKVLLLDDEKFLVEMYKIKFEQSGYEVSAFFSAYDALEALRKGYDPDVMLIDITIPNSISGYEFLEMIKKEGLSRYSLKIALTNAGQDAEIARMAELGAHTHLLKANFVPAGIVAAVTEMLKTKRSS